MSFSGCIIKIPWTSLSFSLGLLTLGTQPPCCEHAQVRIWRDTSERNWAPHILSWASSWEPASTCHPSWNWILHPPAKLLQLMACGTEISYSIMPCPICRFMSQVNDYCCFKPPCFGVCYAGTDNQSIWASKILRWLKIRLVSYFTFLPISCKKPSDAGIFFFSHEWELSKRDRATFGSK